LFNRKPKYVAAAETSSLAEGSWLEIASQYAICMGPVGAMLLGSGSSSSVWRPSLSGFIPHRQWGIFVASIFYASGWAMGAYRNF
jgi:hypothetical protein